MKERIRKNAAETPVYTAITYALIAVALFSLPSVFRIEDDGVLFALNLACRAAATLFAFFLISTLKISIFRFGKIPFIAVFLLIAGLIVCINNFPIIGLITGDVRFYENAVFPRYIVYCVAVGVSEETVFRGLILPIVGIKFGDKKRGTFLTVAVSAAIFSACHLFNIFSQGVGATLLQVGYTFLTGGLFGLAFVVTKNILAPIVLHTVFDLGGLIFSLPFGVAYGNMWDIRTIIITAVLGVAVTAACTLYLFKYENFKNKPANDKGND